MPKYAYKIILSLGAHSKTNFCDEGSLKFTKICIIEFFANILRFLFCFGKKCQFCTFLNILPSNSNTPAYFNGIYTLQHCWYVNVKDKAWYRQVRLHIRTKIRFVKIQIVWCRHMIQWYLRLQIDSMYLRGTLYEYVQQTSFVIVMSCTIFMCTSAIRMSLLISTVAL